MPKVSIVVPIYNVSSFVELCVKSLMNQTYKDIEIILVDDGSADDSGQMCDRFSQTDSRIHVIHKKNGGLSDARNVGIDFAKGEYISFVDGDDTVSYDYIEYMLHMLEETSSDLAICSLKKVSNQLVLQQGEKSSPTSQVFNCREALEEMLYARIFSCSACAKLYHRSLFEGIRFPLGKYSEDMFTTWKLIERSNRVAYGSKVCYFYLHRPGSILASDFSPKHLDLFEALKEIEAEHAFLEGTLLRAFAAQYVSAVGETLEKNPPLDVVIEGGYWKKMRMLRRYVLMDKRAASRHRAMALLSYLGIRAEAKCLHFYYRRLKWNR